MYFSTSASVLSLALLARSVSGSPILKSRGVTTKTWKPTAFAAASPNKVTTNVLELTRLSGAKNSRNAAFLKGLTKSGKSSTSSGSSQLISLEEGEEFATSITIGTDTFEVIVDTGSSDTWVVETGFQCVNLDTGADTDEAECAFGSTWTVEDTFTTIEGEFFDIEYGDGEYLSGVMGYESVTLAGITVTNQTMAVVTSAAWEGDNTTSGLTGLAYPSLTSAYSDTTDDQIEYNPIITSMIDDGLISPLFSLAILRDVSGPSGYLALGGLPPVSFTEDFTTTPIEITTVEGYPTTYDFYTISIDGVTINGKSVSSSGASAKYIVDSGTTLNYYPTSIANEVNAAFDPPGVYSEDDGVYIVDCDAKPPTHGVTINGKTFTINPLDMILWAGTDDEGNSICISGVDDGGSDADEDVYILGDTFQKNVVTVFDVGAVEMRFAPHVDYESNDTY